jgi:hypothetical protein
MANVVELEKRVKERTIAYVLGKVGEWRKYYEDGLTDEHGELTKLTLDESANRVRLSRKTLDDYYAQIRRGKELGFDFEGEKDAKMGQLRKFVKAHKKRGTSTTAPAANKLSLDISSMAADVVAAAAAACSDTYNGLQSADAAPPSPKEIVVEEEEE